MWSQKLTLSLCDRWAKKTKEPWKADFILKCNVFGEIIFLSWNSSEKTFAEDIAVSLIYECISSLYRKMQMVNYTKISDKMA